MLGAFYNVDNSFFKLSIKNTSQPVSFLPEVVSLNDITKDVINIQIHEELNTFVTGSVTLFDPKLKYIGLLGLGQQFTLAWGYQKFRPDVVAKMKLSNPVEMVGGAERTGLNCVVSNCEGGSSADGVVTYTAQFYASLYLDDKSQIQKWENGTKIQVVMDCFSGFGMLSGDMIISFEGANDIISSDNPIYRSTSIVRFLSVLAFEWKCYFSLGYDANGSPVGLFIDTNKVGSVICNSYYEKTFSGKSVGNTKFFEYGLGGTSPNVISYSWKNHAGESGTGDGARITLVNGLPMIQRYFVVGKEVVAMRLNQAKLEGYLDAVKGADNPELEATNEVMLQILQATSYDSKVGDRRAGDFFDKVTSETAPQGFGFSISLECFGDVMIIPPCKVLFGKGFPNFMYYLQVTPLQAFYVKSVTHSLNQNGYRCSVEIGDVITTFGGMVTTAMTNT